ncbi:MAG TPA: hypothetical protein VGJ67_07545 [Actinomycetota bacterium]
MTAKKRRRRRPATTRAEAVATETPETELDEETVEDDGVLEPLLVPGILSSLRAGVIAVTTTPLLLAIPFLFVFLLWTTLVLLGLQVPPSGLVDAMGIPPISTVFDFGVAQAIFGYAPSSLLLAFGIAVVRAVVLAILAGLMIDVLEGSRPSMYGLLRGIRAIPTVVAVNFLIITATVFGTQLFVLLGPGLSLLGSLAVLIGGLYFLVFAPASAVREAKGVQESIRRSGRAARLRFPGGSHLIMVMVYFLVGLPLLLFAAGRVPGGSDATANPSVAVWALVLVATFVHMVFLAAFFARFMGVEPEIPDKPVRRSRAARGAQAPARRR